MKSLIGVIISCFVCLFLASACSSGIEGSVFLDENANNTKEDSESRIAFVGFKITKDDVVIKESQTNSKGKFSDISLEGSGTYCAEVTESDLTATNADGTEPSVVSGLVVGLTHDNEPIGFILALEDSSIENSCEDNLDNDSDGQIDCNDSDCSSEEVCQDDSQDDQEDTDDGGDTATRESGKACEDSAGEPLVLDVPISVDYSTSISNLTDPSTISISRGDTFSIEIKYPQSCTFNTYNIDTALEALGVSSDAYDAATGDINFNKVIQSLVLSTESSIVINRDPLNSFNLSLQAAQIGILGDDTVTIQPSVTCPDNSDVTLKKHTIEINSDDDFDIENTEQSGSWELDAVEKVNVEIEQTSSADYSGGTIDLTITTPAQSSQQSYTFVVSTGTCDVSGEIVECNDLEVDDLPITIQFEFKIVDSVNSTTTFTFSSEMTVTSNGTTATYSGNSIPRDIAPP